MHVSHVSGVLSARDRFFLRGHLRLSPEYPNPKSLFSQGGSLYGLDLSTPFLTLFVPHYLQGPPSPPVKIVPQTQSPSGDFSVNPSLSFPCSGASGLAIPDVSGDYPRPMGPAHSVTSELSPSSLLHQVSHSFVPCPPAACCFPSVPAFITVCLVAQSVLGVPLWSQRPRRAEAVVFFCAAFSHPRSAWCSRGLGNAA